MENKKKEIEKMQKEKRIILKTSITIASILFILASCSKKSNDKNYVVGNDFDEDSFIAEMMTENRSDETNGKFIASDEPFVDESVFESCVVPDLSCFRYGLNKTGDGVKITDYLGTDIVNLKFPEEIEGIPVVGIDFKAMDHNEIETIVIPDSVTEIGYIVGMQNLKNVKLSKSIEKLLGFDDCPLLTSIIIPDGIKAIDRVFSNSGITSLVIPNSVTELGGGVFSGCKELKQIKLPNSITKIPAYAFANCTALESITIPEGVTVISDSAFEKCKSLANVEIPDSVKKIGYLVFNECSSLEKLVVPEGVETIDSGAFSSYYNKLALVSLELPDSVVDFNCDLSSLKKLEYLKLPNSIKKIDVERWGLNELKNLRHINIPSSCEEIDFGIIGDENLEEVDIPDSLTHIEFRGSCFYGAKLNLATQKRLRELGYEGEF